MAGGAGVAVGSGGSVGRGVGVAAGVSVGGGSGVAVAGAGVAVDGGWVGGTVYRADDEPPASLAGMGYFPKGIQWQRAVGVVKGQVAAPVDDGRDTPDGEVYHSPRIMRFACQAAGFVRRRRC